jgi:serine/threonine protein kinase
VRGLAACHAFGIIHRDIKTSNLFLEARGSSDRASPFRVRIGDFGICRVVGLRRMQKSASMNKKFLNIFGVSIRYAAPEVLRRLSMFRKVCEEDDVEAPAQGAAASAEQERASDVYSFAIVLYELLFRQVPFVQLGNEELIRTVCLRDGRPSIDAQRETSPMTQALVKIMKLSWDGAWETRPSFDDIDGTIGLLSQA